VERMWELMRRLEELELLLSAAVESGPAPRGPWRRPRVLRLRSRKWTRLLRIRTAITKGIFYFLS